MRETEDKGKMETMEDWSLSIMLINRQPLYLLEQFEHQSNLRDNLRIKSTMQQSALETIRK
eukprot:716152-Ditylum_brightwellii.AAC.1